MDTQVADPLIGVLIEGRYRIRGRVARGGMATVYTATDERLERTVALKIIHPAQANDPRFLHRFTDEAKAIARLTHPNVVAVYDQGTHDGLPYLAMEYVRGRTLRELLSERRRLPADEALAVLEQMLAAVAAAHRAGLVHRDIKPENVLIAEAPGGGGLVDAVVKVADFGLAKAVEASTEEAGAHLLATVAYVAPELVTDNHADPRTDVYSTGIVLFEMLTGRVPYHGSRPVEVAWQHVDRDVPPPSKYVTDLPASLDDLVVRATRRDPGGRPTDAGAFLAEVQAVRDDLDSVTVENRASAQPTVPVAQLPRSSGPPTQVMPADRGRVPLVEPRHSYSHYATRGPEPQVRRSANARSGLRARYVRLVRTRRGRQAVLAGLIVLGLLLITGVWWVGFGRYTDAPSLTGLTKAQAVAKARSQGLTVRFDGGRFSEKEPIDTVLDQRPDGGQRIVKGAAITVTLSKGPERYKVPDEGGKAFDAAAADLTLIKLVPKRVDQYDDAMPAGNVLGTDPPAGTVVTPGQEITVKVSKGKAPITVPNVVGMDADQAQQQLSQLGLVPAVTRQQSDKPANQVIAQDPPDGSGAQKGQQVTLTVSSGPPTVPVPDVTNQDQNTATQMLEQQGLVANPVFSLGGHVHQQSPSPGTQVPRGTQVQLWIYPP